MNTAAIHEQYAQRINELLQKLGENQDRATIEACIYGTTAVLEGLYGLRSQQCKAFWLFRRQHKSLHVYADYQLMCLAESIKGILLNTLEELRAGLIRNIATEAAGEVIGGLVGQAKACLEAGYVQSAAVLAAAALEDALKRKAEEMGESVEGRSLEDVINFLKSKSFFSGPQGPIVSSYIKLRNAAMHAEWDKIKEADVSSLIAFLEPFLMEHFS